MPDSYHRSVAWMFDGVEGEVFGDAGNGLRGLVNQVPAQGVVDVLGRIEGGYRFVTQGFGFNFYFGGTSLLIVVGVAMDTVQQIESKLVEHHYTGFLKKSRVRGRRF